MMLTIHITEAEPAACGIAAPGNSDSLAACLAQHGVPPDVIQTALAALAQVKKVVLCKPSDVDAWELAGLHILIEPFCRDHPAPERLAQ